MSATSEKKKRSSKVVTLQVVENSDSSSNPIVVSFQGGVPESADGAKASFTWQKLSSKSKNGRKLVGSDEHCRYVSQARGLLYDSRRTKLCVGIYDKKRKIVTIQEAASRGTVFTLNQTVPSYTETHGVVDNGPNPTFHNSYSTQAFQDFGSAKKKKVLKSQAANQVDINHVVGAGSGSAVMEQVLKGEGMSASNKRAIADSKGNGVNRLTNKAVDTAYELSRRLFLPAYNSDAVKPHKVYNAREIAGDAAWNRIFKKVDACSHEEDPQTAILESIQERDRVTCFEKLIKSISPEMEDAKDRYTCAILANWAIKFYGQNQRKRSIFPPDETSSSYFGMPTELASRFFAIFTTQVNGDDGKIHNSMSKQNKDKCIVHALILLMMAGGRSMKISNLQPVATALKVKINDCSTMMRLAGCTVAKKGSTVSAVLKTPLVFPPPKRRGKKK